MNTTIDTVTIQDTGNESFTFEFFGLTIEVNNEKNHMQIFDESGDAPENHKLTSDGWVYADGGFYTQNWDESHFDDISKIIDSVSE